MGGIFDFLAVPLGAIMRFIYYYLSFENYGLAIIVFTIFTRIILFPLNLKQYKSSAKMQQINPKLEELRKKYGNDKQQLNEETMKLYQEEKINPMGSCLPMLVQLPIILALYRVITNPLKHLLQMSQTSIDTLNEIYKTVKSIDLTRIVPEIEVLDFFRVNTVNTVNTEILSAEQIEAVSKIIKPEEYINMNFLGLDLSKVPSFSPSVIFGEQMSTYLPLLLIPIIGVVVSYLSTKVSMAVSQKQAQTNPQVSSMNRSMMLMGPVMTLIFSFQLPAGVLVYWIAGYFIQMAQQLYVNKYILKIKETAEEQQINELKRKRGRKSIQGDAVGGELSDSQGVIVDGLYGGGAVEGAGGAGGSLGFGGSGGNEEGGGRGTGGYEGYSDGGDGGDGGDRGDRGDRDKVGVSRDANGANNLKSPRGVSGQKSPKGAKGQQGASAVKETQQTGATATLVNRISNPNQKSNTYRNYGSTKKKRKV